MTRQRLVRLSAAQSQARQARQRDSLLFLFTAAAAGVARIGRLRLAAAAARPLAAAASALLLAKLGIHEPAKETRLGVCLALRAGAGCPRAAAATRGLGRLPNLGLSGWQLDGAVGRHLHDEWLRRHHIGLGWGRGLHLARNVGLRLGRRHGWRRHSSIGAGTVRAVLAEAAAVFEGDVVHGR